MQSQTIQSCFHSFRSQLPLVHNITNFVAMSTSANVLLAAGASPAMVHAIEEAPEFVKLCSALTINVGTLSTDFAKSMLKTAAVAHEHQIPWVLDPVAVGATAFRQKVCAELLELKPDIIRGNASEIMALAGMSSQSKGPDSGNDVADAKAAAQMLTKFAKVVAVTGEVDWVTDGTSSWSIHHGDVMMTKVTAIGCALTALIAGFAGANREAPAAATVSALSYYGQAGELAIAKSSGPGSFYVNFLDALYQLDAQTVANQAKVITS